MAKKKKIPEKYQRWIDFESLKSDEDIS